MDQENHSSDSPLEPWVDPALEARIVALILGEASDFERAELLETIAAQPELRAFYDRIESTHRALKLAESPNRTSPEPKWKLPNAKREALLETFRNPAENPAATTLLVEATPRRLRKRLTPWLAIAAAVALMAITLTRLVFKARMEQVTAQVSAEEQLSARGEPERLEELWAIHPASGTKTDDVYRLKPDSKLAPDHMAMNWGRYEYQDGGDASLPQATASPRFVFSNDSGSTGDWDQGIDAVKGRVTALATAPAKPDSAVVPGARGSLASNGAATNPFASTEYGFVDRGEASPTIYTRASGRSPSSVAAADLANPESNRKDFGGEALDRSPSANPDPLVAGVRSGDAAVRSMAIDAQPAPSTEVKPSLPEQDATVAFALQPRPAIELEVELAKPAQPGQSGEPADPMSLIAESREPGSRPDGSSNGDSIDSGAVAQFTPADDLKDLERARKPASAEPPAPRPDAEGKGFKLAEADTDAAHQPEAGAAPNSFFAGRALGFGGGGDVGRREFFDGNSPSTGPTVEDWAKEADQLPELTQSEPASTTAISDDFSWDPQAGAIPDIRGKANSDRQREKLVMGEQAALPDGDRRAQNSFGPKQNLFGAPSRESDSRSTRGLIENESAQAGAASQLSGSDESLDASNMLADLSDTIAADSAKISELGTQGLLWGALAEEGRGRLESANTSGGLADDGAAQPDGTVRMLGSGAETGGNLESIQQTLEDALTFQTSEEISGPPLDKLLVKNYDNGGDLDVAVADQPVRAGSEDAEFSPPATDPELAARTAEVDRLQSLAAGYSDIGRYANAEQHYNKILSIDKYNEDARRGLEEVEQRRDQYFRNARDHMRSNMLSQVDELWEWTVPTEDRSDEASLDLASDAHAEQPESGSRWGESDDDIGPRAWDAHGGERLSFGGLGVLGDVFDTDLGDELQLQGERGDGETDRSSRLEEPGERPLEATEKALEQRLAESRSELLGLMQESHLVDISKPIPKWMSGSTFDTDFGSILMRSKSDETKAVEEVDESLERKLQLAEFAEPEAEELSRDYLAAKTKYENLKQELGRVRQRNAKNLRVDASQGGELSARAAGKSADGSIVDQELARRLERFRQADDEIAEGKRLIDLGKGKAALPILSAALEKLPATPMTQEKRSVAEGLIEVARRTKASPDLSMETLTSDEPFSTFSLNVSDVSFKLARTALLDNNSFPEGAKVRVEEFVNAFDYGDPAPSLSEKVACHIDQAAHPFLQQRNLMRVSMQTAAAGRATSQPLRLTILLDKSGSMERADREESVLRTMQALAKHLGPADLVTAVAFARQPHLIADQLSGDRAGELVGLVAATPSEGGTNLEEALKLADSLATRQFDDTATNRIVLITDGAANLGDADPESLKEKIIALRQRGIAFDACGVGADGLNDTTLEALTRKGDGRYYFLDRPDEADANFVRQLAGSLRPAAKNVKVQIKFNPERVSRYRLAGFEKHRLEKEDFRDDKVDAAEMAAAESGNAIYQFEAAPQGSGDIGEVSVRFLDTSSGQMVERSWPIPYQPNAPRLSEAKPAIQLAATAAFLGEKLKGGPAAQAIDLAELAPITNQLRSTDQAPEVQQLIQMVERARSLQP